MKTVAAFVVKLLQKIGIGNNTGIVLLNFETDRDKIHITRSVGQKLIS